MAEKLDKTPVKMGYVIPMKNTKRRFAEDEMYYAIKFEDSTGKNEFWALFTDRSIAKFRPARIEDGKSEHKTGRLLYRHTVNGGRTWRTFVMLVMPGYSKPTMYAVTDNVLNSGVQRAGRNPEDLPKQGWFSDLKD